MYSVLYKNTNLRRVVDLPNGLSKLRILRTFHNHDLMIRIIHPGCEIIADSVTKESTTPNSPSTTFTTRDLHSGHETVGTLTSVDDGLGMSVEIGLGNRIVFQWTVQERTRLGDDSSMEKVTSMHDQDQDQDHSPGSESLCLLEAVSVRLLRPCMGIIKDLMDSEVASVVARRMVDLLEGLEEGSS